MSNIYHLTIVKYTVIDIKHIHNAAQPSPTHLQKVVIIPNRNPVHMK